LTWENVDVQNRLIHVKKTKCPGYVWTPKKRRERVVPVPKPLSKRLKEWRDIYTDHVHDGTDIVDPKFLNLSKLGNPISESGFQKQWQKTRREIGLPKELTLHCFRHTAASRWIRNGMDVSHVQKILGHAQIETTMIYVHMSSSDIKDAMDEIYEGMSG
jgi:integrase/recombinase XerD